QLDFDGRRFKRLEMIPVVLSLARTRAASGAEAALIRKRMTGLCAELGAAPVAQDGRLAVAAPPNSSSSNCYRSGDS
ncbi:MAG: hypothetical protein PHS14_12560, partial [Elusimicrobia bacterium]|nr:hypothetical protein [Elusimicrobiota bacterium]